MILYLALLNIASKVQECDASKAEYISQAGYKKNEFVTRGSRIY